MVHLDASGAGAGLSSASWIMIHVGLAQWVRRQCPVGHCGQKSDGLRRTSGGLESV
ncbi:hypothetical protein PR003_g11751 [Phytophthora rubi]|uniref:Uncharacterized protein n=1 Tax=Phytophthora rubi TaxID=129364 RepID=A0A6A3MQQ3_9STRA|nr:hypothetical protein PR002_g11176 [Phytophthora rubi]KAE9031124.1 hypothetical protein PR001_g11095 [Phytophthora rubi]KAE9337945.1 hypothetical protein PR003_g11751 [Phytophthora rubi]